MNLEEEKKKIVEKIISLQEENSNLSLKDNNMIECEVCGVTMSKESPFNYNGTCANCLD